MSEALVIPGDSYPLVALLVNDRIGRAVARPEPPEAHDFERVARPFADAGQTNTPRRALLSAALLGLGSRFAHRGG